MNLEPTDVPPSPGGTGRGDQAGQAVATEAVGTTGIATGMQAVSGAQTHRNVPLNVQARGMTMHNNAKTRMQTRPEQKTQSKPEAKPSSGRKFLLLLGALAVFGAGGVAGASLLSYRQGTPVAVAQQGIQAGSGIPAGVSLTSWQNNGQGGRYVMRVIEGSVPDGAQLSGVVTSDTDCDADAQGLSHCHNGITLSNGVRITAVNSHNMMRFQCLDPGQSVSITRLDGSWIIAKT